MKFEFAIIGGDERNVYLANIISDEGYKVGVCSLDSEKLGNNIFRGEKVWDIIDDETIIIGPLPFMADNNYINTKSRSDISLDEFLSASKCGKLCFGGYISKEVIEYAKERDLEITDYYAIEEVAIKNAVPTAEGAIQTAMRLTPFTLFGSRCLVLGYGKIGKVISNMLKGIGAHVSIFARKTQDLATIESLGFCAVSFEELHKVLENCEIIFNTVPNIILDDELLNTVSKDCYIIDLASDPGGVDSKTARELDLNYIRAQSLPGRTSPLTAAKIIKDGIFNVLKERQEEMICKSNKFEEYFKI